MKRPWKDRLYASYVSSGQVNPLIKDSHNLFSSCKPFLQKVIRHHIPLNRDAYILDLGCGHGSFLYFLNKMGYKNIHGVDVSIEQIALAHSLGINQVEQKEIYDYLNTVKDETIDVVLLIDVLEHLSRQELFDMLDEVLRILRPGGKCIIHLPNASGLFGMQAFYGDLTHEMAFTPKSVSQLLSVIGFHDVRCFEDKPVVHGITSAIRWILWNLGSLPSKLLLSAEIGSFSSILSQNMLVTAVKYSPLSTKDQNQ